MKVSICEICGKPTPSRILFYAIFVLTKVTYLKINHERTDCLVPASASLRMRGPV